MKRYIRTFLRSEAGATTVDWVVITAMGMSMALAAFSGIKSGTSDITSEVSSVVENRPTTIDW